MDKQIHVDVSLVKQSRQVSEGEAISVSRRVNYHCLWGHLNRQNDQSVALIVSVVDAIIIITIRMIIGSNIRRVVAAKTV